MRIDDPELVAKFEALKAAGYRYQHQEDARIAWLELEVALLARDLGQLEGYIEALEGRLLTQIDGKPRPHWPDPEPEQPELDL